MRETMTIGTYDPTPAIGDTVHYQAYGTPGGEYPSVPRAAIVTAVHSDKLVDLCVLNPTGQFFNQGVKYSEQPKPGCWNFRPLQMIGSTVGPEELAELNAAEAYLETRAGEKARLEMLGALINELQDVPGAPTLAEAAVGSAQSLSEMTATLDALSAPNPRAAVLLDLDTMKPVPTEVD